MPNTTTTEERTLKKLALRGLNEATVRAAEKKQPKAYRRLMRALERISLAVYGHTPLSHIFVTDALRNGEVLGLWDVAGVVCLASVMTHDRVDALIQQHCSDEEQRELELEPPETRLYQLRRLHPDVLPAIVFDSPATRLCNCLYEDHDAQKTWILERPGDVRECIGDCFQVSTRVRGTLARQTEVREEFINKVLRRADTLRSLMKPGSDAKVVVKRRKDEQGGDEENECEYVKPAANVHKQLQQQLFSQSIPVLPSSPFTPPSSEASSPHHNTEANWTTPQDAQSWLRGLLGEESNVY